jgi:RsiW-degrading membrane proteinase PrsW (M82 family)
MIDYLRFPLSLLPVVAFLSSLVFMDSFKLVSVRSVVQAIVIGGVVALACYFINGWLLSTYEWPGDSFPRYGSPLVEELLKPLFVVFLIQARRVGFIVDSAIYGFALGTGFALVENIYYLQALGEVSLKVWLVRGFGTAIMHGSTTAILAVIAKGLQDRHPKSGALAYLPGFAIALLLHSTFNHFPLGGAAQAAILLIVMPLLTVSVFERSEKATREWLGTGFDTDLELLELIGSGEIQGSRVGEYLQSLKSTFPGQVVGDMLSMLQIHLELSIRAKGILMAREAGIRVEPDEMVKANLEELKFLEKSVGKTGKLAMTPFLNMTSRDLWQLYMLGK